MLDVFKIEPKTVINQESSYILSYPHILSYAQSVNTFGKSDFIRLSHMVYGWMPTVLDLYPDRNNISLDEGAALFQKAKLQGFLSKHEIDAIAKVVNNSLVGTSKMLHFISPETFAIWDSKIYTFIHSKKAHNYRVNDSDTYLKYLETLSEIKERFGFQDFHSSVNTKMGYKISAFRAIELIMFSNTPRT